MDENERTDPFYSDGCWMTVPIWLNWFTGEYMRNPTDHPHQFSLWGSWQASPSALLFGKNRRPRFYG